MERCGALAAVAVRVGGGEEGKEGRSDAEGREVRWGDEGRKGRRVGAAARKGRRGVVRLAVRRDTS